MTPQFITLKSGCRINAAHIVQYSAFLPNPEKLWIEVSSGVEGENEKCEDMTASELDALLSPPSSPIVDSVVNLDKLKPGAGCQFTFEGAVKHGVIENINSAFINIVSGGVNYSVEHETGIIR